MKFHILGSWTQGPGRTQTRAHGPGRTLVDGLDTACFQADGPGQTLARPWAHGPGRTLARAWAQGPGRTQAQKINFLETLFTWWSNCGIGIHT